MITKDYDNLLHFENLSRFDSLFHFTTTIQGGVSRGNYATFNLGMYCGDDIDCVAENRERLAGILHIAEEDLLVPYQTHGDKILVIDSSFQSKTDLEKIQSLNGVDALITNLKNICIGVTTADCVPILVYDPTEGVLAAIHAGWKGTVARIAGKTIKLMIEIFGCRPPNLYAGVAPCISQKHFEVGEEVVDIFLQNKFSIETIGFRNPVSGKMHINLPLANSMILQDAGIPLANIEESGLCTFSNPDLFFSARRQSVNSGRMLSGGTIL